MQRALDRLSHENFDVLIIGGGATGCFTARDAALRGLKVALVEARDFACATSAHNSKLAHGGLRYLRNFELGLVRESLRERRHLLRIAPHLVRPLAFLLPLYQTGAFQKALLSAGLSLYDILAYDRNRCADPDQQMPGHRWLKAQAAGSREPVLAGRGLQGAFEYYDAQMYSPERIALENVLDADAQGAAIANYVAGERLLLRNGKLAGCTVRDTLSDAVFDICAATVVIAAGPWADLFLQQATGEKPVHRLIRSKGIHLLVPRLSQSALTLQAGSAHLFALPWRGHSLLATTDTEFQGDPATVAVSEQDIDGLLALFRTYLPAAPLGRDSVEFFYAGLRPLVRDGSGRDPAGSYNVSRRCELVDHGKEGGIDGLFSALGGKYTTSRGLAEKTTDALVAKLGKPAHACATATTPLPGGGFARFQDMVQVFEKSWPGISTIGHLAHMLGSRLVQALQGATAADLAALGPSGDTALQVGFALRTEMALCLEDMVMRRTTIGQFGRPDPTVVERVADQMGNHLGWSVQRKAREISSLDRLYQVAP